MRKPMIIAATAAALVLVAPATPSFAAAGHDLASGTGRLAQFGDPKVHVTAVQTKNGAKGRFTVTYPDGSAATGGVSCLAVSGNTAYVTGRITSARGPRVEVNRWALGNYLIIGVRDNARPRTAGADTLNFSPGFTSDPGCGPHDDALPVFSIVAGDYWVVDAR